MMMSCSKVQQMVDLYIMTNFISKTAPSCKASTKSFYKPVVALAAFGLGGGDRRIWRCRRTRQPESNEYGDRFVCNSHMPLDTFHLAADPIKPARQRRFQSIGPIGRQMRGDGCLDDQSLRHPLARCVIGEFDGEVRRQSEGVLRPHATCACRHRGRATLGARRSRMSAA